MDLTYENIKMMLENYFDALPSIEGPQDEAKILEYFAPDFKIFWPYGSVASIIQTREEWVKHLCSHADDYRALVSYQPPPQGLVIDEKRKTASMLITEEFKNPTTGQDVQPRMYIGVYWKLCVHDNKIKAKEEIITVIPMNNPGNIWGGV